MCFAQKAGSNVEAEVEGFTVEGLVVVAELGALVGVEHLLVDDAGGGENRLAGELTELTGVIPYVQVCSRDALDGTRMFVRVEMREDAGALNQLIFKGLADKGRLGDARRGTVVNGQPGQDVVVKVRDVLIGHTLKAL